MTATLRRARDSGQAVGDHDNGLVRDELCHGALYHGLVLRVYVCRSLIQHDDRRAFSIARAMAMRCRSPPERCAPPPPTTVP